MMGRVSREEVSGYLDRAAFIPIRWSKGRRVRVLFAISGPNFVVHGEELKVLRKGVLSKVVFGKRPQGVEFRQAGFSNTELIKSNEPKGRNIITTGRGKEKCAGMSNRQKWVRGARVNGKIRVGEGTKGQERRLKDS